MRRLIDALRCMTRWSSSGELLHYRGLQQAYLVGADFKMADDPKYVLDETRINAAIRYNNVLYESLNRSSPMDSADQAVSIVSAMRRQSSDMKDKGGAGLGKTSSQADHDA